MKSGNGMMLMFVVTDGGRGDSVTHKKGIKSETTGSGGGGGWLMEGSVSACNPQEYLPPEIKQVIKDIRP